MSTKVCSRTHLRFPAGHGKITDLRLAAYPFCPSYPYFFMRVKEFQAQHDKKSDHHSESFKRCKYLLRQLTAQSNGDVTRLPIISHPTLPTYCNIGAKRSPRTSSTFLIHRNVSPSTASSSSSCSSLINGNISGNNANHSSPSRSVKLSSHRTAVSLTVGSSERV